MHNTFAAFKRFQEQHVKVHDFSTSTATARDSVSDYSPRALFIYDTESAALVETCQQNPVGTDIQPLPLDDFAANPDAAFADGINHVVVSASLQNIKRVLSMPRAQDTVFGILPRKGQDRLRRYLDLPRSDQEALRVALRSDPKPTDLVTCNGEMVLFGAVVGWLPLLDGSDQLNRWDLLKRVFRQWGRLNLYNYRITTANDKEVRTAATGCMVFDRHQGDIISRLIGEQHSVRDGQVGMVVASPTSRMGYLRFLYQVFSQLKKRSGLPASVGYIKSRGFRIESDKPRAVLLDGETEIETPLEVAVQPGALKMNLGDSLMQADKTADDKETVRTGNLPDEEEAARAVGTRVPFFSYASEEHFKELFVTLNKDAEIDTTYVIFVLVSTCIATLGLYLDSVAVIIGAMIIAPLMAPLGSAGMALLRGYEKLLFRSAEKLALGIGLTLAAAASISLLFPYNPVTQQMAARVEPSLPDLFVAIFSGVAAAYARAYKEISQTLAGVAISVALVPPLAVAGIGLGRGEIGFFLQAFLLFFTNFVGIILAATLAFRVLGFSSAVLARRQIGVMLLFLIIISVPLALTSAQIADRWAAEQRLESLELIVNGRPVEVISVEREPGDGGARLLITLGITQPLASADYPELQRQIEEHLHRDYHISLSFHYVLGRTPSDLKQQ